ncbi:Reverse transcriptase (RNA-dependent DNA polymerase) [Stieleria maiorica]|uniref:Reverse transcriptase (RNA-dependent DNA polymerase) n=1 Tax=Stieleria maiorica TaxID=2795974 RepID=A0A5B9MCV2_9BACT|nr:RNA-directed DNA polymerase [Stieleria maiorica]QEF98878.1 Reverse transcriptase (RNA-dependent DNA polymerase) [Stieleria maiorica]
MSPQEIILLLQQDAEAVADSASRLSPSEQITTLRHVIELIGASKLDSLQVSRALLIAQEILDSSGISLPSRDSADAFRTILRFGVQTEKPRLRQQAIIILGLLGEMGKTAALVFDEGTKQLLNRLAQDRPITSATNSLTSRLENSVNRQRVSSGKSYSIPSIDISKARKNVLEDVKQDWFSDPWGWPEFERLRDESVGKRLEEDECGWTFALDVPKSSDGSRPSILLNPVDRIAFQCLSDELSLVATKDLPDWVFGWRVHREAPSKGTYASNSQEWKLFKKRIQELSQEYDLVLKLDVRSFFETVDTERLVSDLGRSYRKTGTLARLADYFARLRTQRNGDGLPQRCLASSVLAHVPLSAVDRYLSIIGNPIGSTALAPLRWMDDIWLFGNSESHLRSVHSEIEHALGQQGLGVNPAKTVLEECHSAFEDLILDSSGQEDSSAGEQREAFATRLLEIAKSIAESPRSDISFMLKYKGENSEELDEVVLNRLSADGLESFNHAADRVADFLRRKEQWRGYSEWYQQLVRRQADMHSWSIAAWGNMFPIASDASSDFHELHDFFAERFENGIQHSLVPLAVHRLVSWKDGKDIGNPLDYMPKLGPTANFFVVRAIALAAQQFGIDDQEIVKNCDDDYQEEISGIL